MICLSCMNKQTLSGQPSDTRSERCTLRRSALDRRTDTTGATAASLIIGIILYHVPLQDDGAVCTAEMLKREALRIANKLDLERFRASAGYLANFMKRTRVAMWSV